MEINNRIAAFVQWGKALGEFATDAEWQDYGNGLSQTDHEEINGLIKAVKHHNGWFTEENVRFAFQAMATQLTEDHLKAFVAPYESAIANVPAPKRVALIMAGNIPMVGFHDLLCTLLCGHHAVVKLSSQDDKLLPRVVRLLAEISPELADQVEFVQGKLENLEAVIATGSNNSSRYFEHYFGKYPNIIRKNRTSVAVIDEDATEAEMQALGADIFTYFGLGCRNVSKLYFPAGFDRDRFFGGIFGWKDIINHAKYGNNYDYHKALYLMNREEVRENGFVLLKEDEAIAAPPGVLFYEYYDDRAALLDQLQAKAEQIQCIVARDGVPFGEAQKPTLSDFADGVDTMKFLSELR